MSETITRRRAMIAAGAALTGAAATSLPAFAATAEVDPIFAAIERHRAAWTEFNRVIEAAGDEDAVIERVADQAADDRAAWVLAETQPTTLAGCAAALAYAANLQNNHPDHPHLEAFPDGPDDHGRLWAATLQESIATALNSIIASGRAA